MQENLKVKFKKLHPDCVIPQYAKPGDAGVDLTAVSIEFNKKLGCITYDTGLSVEIPEGYVGLIFPRSSIYKTIHSLSNSVGVIDSGYRGSIKFNFRDAYDPHENLSVRFYRYEDDHYQIGDRIGQLVIMPYPKIQFEEVEELSETDRGDGGFGSSGN
jgi:dUTP pyrophosphatase